MYCFPLRCLNIFKNFSFSLHFLLKKTFFLLLFHRLDY